MPGAILSEYVLGDTAVRYLEEEGRVGLCLIPAALRGRIPDHRESGLPPAAWPKAWNVDGLAHYKLVGDAYSGGFSQGRSLRGSPAMHALRHVAQTAVRNGGSTVITTVLAGARGMRVSHRLEHRDPENAFTVRTELTNGGDQPVTLEMLTSFSLGHISPVAADDAPERLHAHRFRSAWSSEGRHEAVPFEALHLERSWTGHCMLNERFGQAGSMPVRGWFPFVGVEDTVAGVMWGAMLAVPGSWQLELYRKDDFVNISGGLADRESGHWMKRLAPGESFAGPEAILACAHGDIDDLCARLTLVQRRGLERLPAVEAALPIVCNEYCTTWGNPSHDLLMAISDRLRGTATKFLVIDAGWYQQEGRNWGESSGDWLPSPKLFPKGLAHTCAEIRARGLIPGLWFEFETMGPTSDAWHQTAHQLTRDGVPIEPSGRRFWNMADPWVHDYLAERVIGLLRSCGVGYIKVDYNECIGIGADHPESLGEGLRLSLEGTQRFFARLRAELPELVIENCASGGHRLEPSFMALSAQASFSDAHELVEIPIVAANLHRLILPRQSQIWAVLKAADTARRMHYSLAATFLGRMAISGDITTLSAEQWAVVAQAQALYQRVAPIIDRGSSRIERIGGASYRHPTGWQAVVRLAEDGRSLLVVAHAFADAPAESVVVRLPAGDWRIIDGLNAAPDDAVIDGELLILRMGAFTGRVVVCARA